MHVCDAARKLFCHLTAKIIFKKTAMDFWTSYSLVPLSKYHAYFELNHAYLNFENIDHTSALHDVISVY